VARPKPKQFDVDKHSESISELTENMSEKKFEKSCESVALDILRNYEGFEGVEKGPKFQGTPFDFFGYKNGTPYIIEFKGSLNHFHTPGETQKRRLTELLKNIEGLKVALLQVKLSKGQYRIFYDDDMEILFRGRKASLKKIRKGGRC
jgi:hypothetical protein